MFSTKALSANQRRTETRRERTQKKLSHSKVFENVEIATINFATEENVAFVIRSAACFEKMGCIEGSILLKEAADEIPSATLQSGVSGETNLPEGKTKQNMDEIIAIKNIQDWLLLKLYESQQSPEDNLRVLKALKKYVSNGRDIFSVLLNAVDKIV